MPGGKVLFVSPEIAPLASTGGLGEVAGSLPRALAELGLEVHLAMPLYRQVDRQQYQLGPSGLRLEVDLPWGRLAAEHWQGRLGRCQIHLIGHDPSFDRQGLYGTPQGDYPDNAQRFVFFCRAVMELARALELRVDVVHCHDWQTALLPALLAFSPDPGPLRQAASLLTIHNLAFQGLFPRSAFALTGLPGHLDNWRGLEYWGYVSFLKAGLLFADGLTTVSPTYAAEILTVENGMGMEGVLATRVRDLSGILNGVDYSQWSPESDPFLPAHYSAQDLGGKQTCRQQLLSQFGLEPAGEETMVMGYVGRLTEQKGVDLLLEALPQMDPAHLRLCLLGSGDDWLQQRVRGVVQNHPGLVGAKLIYSPELAHLLIAGSDLLLVPSRFEPCGLNQLYAMRYGTPPVVRVTGGLKDTVQPFDRQEGSGTGFTFWAPEPQALLDALNQAQLTRARPERWSRVVQNAMAQDFSWARSAKSYAKLYDRLAQQRDQRQAKPKT